jgi:hypothetical protein
MRALLVAALLFSIASPSIACAQQHRPQDNQQSSSSPGPSSPVAAVTGQPAPEPPKEATKAQPQNWFEWCWQPIWSNWALVLVAVVTARAAIRTLHAIDAQVSEMRKTGKQTDKLIQENIAQSRSMAESVRETARFATAMEVTAKSLEITADASKRAADASCQSIDSLRQQMRAWLTVIIGGGVPQQREKGLKFDARPLILNTGLTPARNVRYQIETAILPVPLPDDFDFPLPEKGFGAGGNCIGAHQNAQMIAVANDYTPDEEVDDLKIGKGRSLYSWGTVTYDDVFGASHKTQFCQQLTWQADGNVFGYYTPGHNDAD